MRRTVRTASPSSDDLSSATDVSIRPLEIGKQAGTKTQGQREADSWADKDRQMPIETEMHTENFMSHRLITLEIMITNEMMIIIINNDNNNY